MGDQREPKSAKFPAIRSTAQKPAGCDIGVQCALAAWLCCLTCSAAPDKQFTTEMAHRFLGGPLYAPADGLEASVSEHPEWVDEDPSVVLTEKWLLSYPDGSSLIAFTDDGVVRSFDIETAEFVTDRGVRVGDRLREVKQAYPESTFPGGSNDIVTTPLRLYAERGDLHFRFYDDDLRKMLQQGSAFPVEDPRVADLGLRWISVTDTNNFACGAECRFSTASMTSGSAWLSDRAYWVAAKPLPIPASRATTQTASTETIWCLRPCVRRKPGTRISPSCSERSSGGCRPEAPPIGFSDSAPGSGPGAARSRLTPRRRGHAYSALRTPCGSM